MYQLPPLKKGVRKLVFYLVLPLTLLCVMILFVFPSIDFSGAQQGIVLDSLDGVYVYNNGAVSAVHGRNLTQDGYNIGLEYQCVEFVKRYYLYHYGHRMPDSYGHAKDFFWKGLKSGKFNERRGLNQYSNGQAPRPQKGDIVVFRATLLNRYGHVAIVAGVDGDTVEIIQQNPGRSNATCRTIGLVREGTGYRIRDSRVMGWLRITHSQTDNNSDKTDIP